MSTKTKQSEMTFNDMLPKQPGLELTPVDGVPIAKLVVIQPCVQPSDSFVDNIERYGVLDRPIVIKRDGKMIVRIGRRRVLALQRLVNKYTELIDEKMRSGGDDADIKQAVVDLADQRSRFEVVNINITKLDAVRSAALDLGSNEQRGENPLADLAMIKELIGEGFDMKSISEATGMPQARIERRLQLDGLRKVFITALAGGKITITCAEKLAKMSADEQDEAAGLYRKNGKLTMADLQDLRTANKEAATKALPQSMFAPEDGESDDRAKARHGRTAALAMLRDAERLLPEGDKLKDAIGKLLAGHT